MSDALAVAAFLVWVLVMPSRNLKDSQNNR
jgi:hypothetical protein